MKLVGMGLVRGGIGREDMEFIYDYISLSTHTEFSDFFFLNPWCYNKEQEKVRNLAGLWGVHKIVFALPGIFLWVFWKYVGAEGSSLKKIPKTNKAPYNLAAYFSSLKGDETTLDPSISLHKGWLLY